MFLHANICSSVALFSTVFIQIWNNFVKYFL
jgi:hypothetical protein